MWIVSYLPNVLGDSENYVMANPMQTPSAIVPEWYLLPFYAVLRSIPSKIIGVIAMFFGIVIIILLYITDLAKFKGLNFKPYAKVILFIFTGDFLILMKLGAEHVEHPFIIFGLISTILYFFHYIVVVPLISLIENLFTKISSLVGVLIRFSGGEAYRFFSNTTSCWAT